MLTISIHFKTSCVKITSKVLFDSISPQCESVRNADTSQRD